MGDLNLVHLVEQLRSTVMRPVDAEIQAAPRNARADCWRIAVARVERSEMAPCMQVVDPHVRLDRRQHPGEIHASEV